MTGTPADVPVPRNVHEKSEIVTGNTDGFDQWTDGQTLQEKAHKDHTEGDWYKGVFQITVWQTQHKC